jgi:molybdopterin-guanine dinucleotide biosynthesis protein A
MKRTAAVLAGGESSRLRNKPLAPLAGRPLILHTIDSCKNIVDELLVVVNSKQQSDVISRALGRIEGLTVVIDRKAGYSGPLLGARTAFENSTSESTLLLPCDTPLVKESVLGLLFDTINGKDAVIPRYPNGQIEPLHAVYKTRVSLEVLTFADSTVRRSMRDLIMSLNTIYLSTNVIRKLDPKLDSFINVNTPEELRRMEQRFTRDVW